MNSLSYFNYRLTSYWLIIFLSLIFEKTCAISDPQEYIIENNIQKSVIDIVVQNLDPEIALVLNHNSKLIFDKNIKNHTIKVNLMHGANINYKRNPLFQKFIKKAENTDKSISITVSDDYIFNEYVQNPEFSAWIFSKKKIVQANDVDSKKILLNNSKLKILNDANNNLVFEFPFDSAVGAAAFVDQNDLWIVFDKYKDFDINPSEFKDSNISLKQLQNSPYSILKLRLPKHYSNIKVAKNRNNWKIEAFNKGSTKYLGQNIALKNSNENIFLPKGTPISSLIQINDDDSKKKFLAVTSKAVMRNNILADHSEYKTISSLQGIIVENKSDNKWILDNAALTLKMHNISKIQEQKISKTKLESKLFNSQVNKSTPSILPILQEKRNLDSGSSEIMKTDLIDQEKYYELAKFYFNKAMYHEAAGALNLTKDENNLFYSKDFKASFLFAVCATISNKSDLAKPIFHKLIDALQNHGLKNHSVYSEVKTWQIYNDHLLMEKNSSNSLKGLNLTFLTQYPTEIYWPIVMGLFEIAIANNDASFYTELIASLRADVNSEIKNKLTYFEAMIYQGKLHNNNYAEEKLNKLANQNQDLYIKARASLALIKSYKVRKELTLDSAINEIDKLRFLWRGDYVEHDILTTLAQYHREKSDYISVLRTYAYMLEHLPLMVDQFTLNQECHKLYAEIFGTQSTLEQIDDFQAVTLFYEFKDFLPLGTVGDSIVINMVKKFANIHLTDQAINILEHQLQYRAPDNTKKLLLGNKLALLYLEIKNPQKAMEILNYTDHGNHIYQGYLTRNILRSKALLDLEKYAEALDAIQNTEHPDINKLKKYILFNADMFQDYIDFAEKQLLLEVTNNNYSAEEVLKLAMCYSHLGNFEKLDNLYAILYDSKLKDLIYGLINIDSIDYDGLEEALKTNVSEQILQKYKKSLL